MRSMARCHSPRFLDCCGRKAHDYPGLADAHRRLAELKDNVQPWANELFSQSDIAGAGTECTLHGPMRMTGQQLRRELTAPYRADCWAS
jgi:hypothetical protein